MLLHQDDQAVYENLLELGFYLMQFLLLQVDLVFH